MDEKTALKRFNDLEIDDINLEKLSRAIGRFVFIKICYRYKNKKMFEYSFSKYYGYQNNNNGFETFWKMHKISGFRVCDEFVNSKVFDLTAPDDVTYLSKFANVVEQTFPIFDSRVRDFLLIDNRELTDMMQLVKNTRNLYRKFASAPIYKTIKTLFFNNLYNKFGLTYVRIIDFIIWARK